MSGKRRSNKANIKPWLTAQADADDRPYIQVGSTMFEAKIHGKYDNPFASLPPGEKWLYLCMCHEAGQNDTFKFPQKTMIRCGLDPRTCRRQIDHLVDAGYIEVVMSGKNLRKPNEYKFSRKWKQWPLALQGKV